VAQTAIYVLRGVAQMRHGPDLEQRLEVAKGDFLYIPAGMPHLPFNPSQSEPCLALVAQTDSRGQESVELLPWLEPPSRLR
jgi:uncharacterized RmlC-like cupin family protein